MLNRIKVTLAHLAHSTHTLPVVFLSALFLIIFLTNFPFNTSLIGWDNVLPELNFPLNFSRSFNATWITNQGLGHVGGHGHAANLPHTLVLWLMSFVIPTAQLRPLFMLLMYAAGAYGAYALTYRLLQKHTFARFGAVVAALIYSFNLGTIQQFFTPLEAFIIFHGLLPWVLLAIFSLLDSPRITARQLLGFSILSWFFSAIGFLPPLFVVYGLILLCIFGSYLFSQRSKNALTRVALLGFVILAANLYWLTSVAYFTATSSTDYLNSQNNQLSTDGYNWQSISNGGVLDVALVRGFLYWALDIKNTASDPLYVMQPWFEHYQNPAVIFSAISIFSIALYGIWWSLTRQKRDYRLVALSLVFFLLVISLGQRIPGLSALSLVIKELPVINQAFRAAFTKVSVPFVLSIAVLAGIGFSQLLTLLIAWMRQQNRALARQVSQAVVVTTILILLAYGAPVLQGHLFSTHLKQTFPNAYSEVITFFKTQPATERIAILPLIEHWGWHYTDWGYIGSGFWWYGVEQPILDRSFDAWSKNNETFYQQLNTAILEKNESKIISVLEQYHVKWIILDTHLIPASYTAGPRQQISELKSMFANQGYTSTTFGDIVVFENPNNWENTITDTALEVATGDTTYTAYDSIMDTVGQYISGDTQAFPFANLSSTHGIAVDSSALGYSISGQDPTFLRDNTSYSLVLPKIAEKILATAEISATRTQLAVNLKTELPTLLIDEQKIDINEIASQTIALPSSLPDNGFHVTVGDTVQTISAGAQTPSSAFISIDPIQPLPIQIFSTDSSPVADISEAVKWAGLSDCTVGSQSSGKKYGDVAGTTVVTEGEKACFSAEVGQLTNPTNSPALYTLTFDYVLTGQRLQHMCLSRAEDDAKTCYSGELARDLLNTDKAQNIAVIFQLPVSGTYWLDFQTAPHSQFSIQNVKLASHERIASTNIDPNVWSLFTTAISIKLTQKPHAIQVVLPNDDDFQYRLSDIKSIANCDVFNRGAISLEQKNGRVSLTAEDGGLACLPLTTSDVVSSLIVISGKQNFGKRPEVSVTNLTKKLTEYELSPKNEFVMGIPRLRATVTPEIEQVSLTARSYPNTKTGFTIDDLQIIPVPLQWLSLATIRPTTPAAASPLSPLAASSDWMQNHALPADQKTALVQDQSFDPGWIAFPALQPWKQYEHVRYNGWANAWIIDSAQDSEGTKDQQRITILYWPQLLTFVGYGVLVLTLGGLAWLAWRSRRIEHLKHRIRHQFFS